MPTLPRPVLPRPVLPRPVLLLTRPEADARRMAATLPAPLAGLRRVISPVMRIVAVDHDAGALRDAPGVVFTSAHAVAAAGPGAGRPAICVGARTAAAARAAGFEVTEGAGGAQDLLPLIAAARVPLIHAHGRHVAQALPLPGVVVYDQRPVAPTAEARAVLAGRAPVLLPVFSARSADLVSQVAAGVRAPLWVAAISDAALAPLAGQAARAAVACRPDGQGVIAAMMQIVQQEQS